MASKLVYALTIASLILALSSMLDMVLWVRRGFYVPSWTISLLGICCSLLCVVLALIIRDFEEKLEM